MGTCTNGKHSTARWPLLLDANKCATCFEKNHLPQRVITNCKRKLRRISSRISLVHSSVGNPNGTSIFKTVNCLSLRWTGYNVTRCITCIFALPNPISPVITCEISTADYWKRLERRRKPKRLWVSPINILGSQGTIPHYDQPLTQLLWD